MPFHPIIDNVTRWITGDDRIVAAAVVGSHARDDATPESDIDLVLVCHNPDTLLDDLTWTHQFGSTKTVDVEDYDLVQSVRVFYEDGPEVEFGVTSLAWVAVPVDAGTEEVMMSGLKILYDPDHRLAKALVSAKTLTGT